LAAQIAPKTRTYSINLDEMNKRIGNVPGVKESAVRRMPNGNLVVRVKMYHAVALWSDGEMYFPLSADGTIVNQPTSERNVANVVFRGTVPSDISEITNAAHNLVGRLDYIEWIENRRWNIHTNNGITIMLPEDNAISALGTLIALNTKHQILDRKIKLIDMRDNARILVK
jgi:cell division protein FtsQ